MPVAAVNGIEIGYESFGTGSRTLILLPGASCQMLEWLEPFCEMLVKQDCTVIRVDNRDVGLSTHFDDLCPNPEELIEKARSGNIYESPYSIKDMAKDTAELIKVVSNGPAHCRSFHGRNDRTTSGYSLPRNYRFSKFRSIVCWQPGRAGTVTRGDRIFPTPCTYDV